MKKTITDKTTRYYTTNTLTDDVVLVERVYVGSGIDDNSNEPTLNNYYTYGYLKTQGFTPQQKLLDGQSVNNNISHQLVLQQYPANLDSSWRIVVYGRVYEIKSMNTFNNINVNGTYLSLLLSEIGSVDSLSSLF